MRTRGLLAVLLLCATPLAGMARAESGAAAVAAAITDPVAECNFLVLLCREANRASERAALVPGGVEALAFKRDHEALLSLREAVEAARVIERKHGGKRPWCFDDPECAFLKEALPRR